MRTKLSRRCHSNRQLVRPKRIVIDTNVYLSALLFGGNPRKVVETALLDGDIVIISEEIYTEMRKVISKKFPEFLVDYNAFEAVLREHTILISLGFVSVTVCRDPKDNVILETAKVGDCNVIVTGDKDLLQLNTYQDISILTPKKFIQTELLKL